MLKEKKFGEWIRDYWIYILVYVFFLYVSFTSARAGDDWEISGWYRNNIVSTLAGMIRATNYLNGRIANNLFDSFFAYYDLLWKLISPLVFTSIIYLSGKLFNYHNKVVPNVVNFLMLISVSSGIRKETFVWLIGNVSYIFVIPFILLYFNILLNNDFLNGRKIFQKKAYNYILFGFLSFFIGLWIENITVGFTLVNILILIYSHIKYKKIHPRQIYGVVGSFLSCFVIFGSPARMETLATPSLGLSEQIISNFPNIIRFVVVDNLSIYLIFCVVFILILLKKEFITCKTFKILELIYAFSFTIIVLIRKLLVLLAENWYWQAQTYLNSFDGIFFDVNKPFSLIFCLSILIFIFIALCQSKQKEKLLVLYLLGLGSVGSMIISPRIGARTFSLLIILIGPMVASMASDVKYGSKDLRTFLKISLVCATIFQMEQYFFYGKYTQQVETVRMQGIESYRSGIKDGSIDSNEWLVLPAHDTDVVIASANPGPNDFHMQPFKEYYHLPENASVVFDNGFGVKHFDVEKVDGLLFKLEIDPLNDVSDYTYTFYVENMNRILYVSDEKTENYDYFQFPDTGIYTIKCKMHNETEEHIVYLGSIEIK